MNSPKTGLRVASVFFGIFAIGHLLRLINQAQVTVGTLTIPMGVSWIALIVAPFSAFGFGDWLRASLKRGVRSIGTECRSCLTCNNYAETADDLISQASLAGTIISARTDSIPVLAKLTGSQAA